VNLHPGSGPSAALRSASVDRAAPTADPLSSDLVWYHTLELPDGVITPGHVDLRRVAGRLLPDDLAGLRALDVGTFDGFWAFELERRGAEVVAIDIDHVSAAEIPPNNRVTVEREAREFGVELGRGFAVAAELLGSQVRRISCSVLDLTAEAIGGPVDVAFMGALLIHLRDPVAALERIFAALVPGGSLYQLETVSPRLSLLHPRRPAAELHTLATGFNWWYPNARALRAYLRTAGFVDISGRGFHHPPQRRPMNDWYYGIRSRRP
jgi:SAM-dependent methyltransferase